MAIDNDNQGENMEAPGIPELPGVLGLQVIIQTVTEAFQKEKLRCIGTTDKTAAPVKSILFHGKDEATLLTQPLFHEGQVDDLEQFGMSTALLIMAFHAHAVAVISDAWTSSAIPSCGSLSANDTCGQCESGGEETDSPALGKEILFASLHFRAKEDEYLWLSNIVRNDKQKIVRLDDVAIAVKGKSEALSTLGNPYSVEEWMLPHIVANLSTLCKLLGRSTSKLECEATRLAKSHALRGFKFLRLDRRQVSRAIRPLRTPPVHNAQEADGEASLSPTE